METKKNIYFARTYRRLHIDIGRSLLFATLLIVPSIIFLIMNVNHITQMISWLGVELLSKVIPADLIEVNTSQYSILNVVEYIELPTTLPTRTLIFWNLAICLVIVIFMLFMKKTGRPIAIFFLFGTVIHIVSCIYFLFAGREFPYTLGIYSDIYLKQEIGIWITYVILAGLLVSFIGENGYIFKFSTYITVMVYSIVFGTVRYILYLFILYRFSALYMALLFFVLGPMFDFSYFVAIYAIFVNKNIKEYELGKKKGVWKWS